MKRHTANDNTTQLAVEAPVCGVWPTCLHSERERLGTPGMRESWLAVAAVSYRLREEVAEGRESSRCFVR